MYKKKLVFTNNNICFQKKTSLNQIYDILTELHKQGKQLTLCKVPAYIGIKRNEEADKAAKQAIDMPGMTTARLQPDYQEG